MSYKIMFVLSAIAALLLGVALLFVPASVLEQFRTEGRVAEVFLARVLGAALTTIGLLWWFAKDAAEPSVQKGLGVVGLIGAVLALFVTILGVSPLVGVIRVNGWIPIVVEVMFGLGYAFLLFLQPKMK
jgi:hypothetical protein